LPINTYSYLVRTADVRPQMFDVNSVCECIQVKINTFFF